MKRKRPGMGAMGDEVERYAVQLGWRLVRSGGSHNVYGKGDKSIAISRSNKNPLGKGKLVATLKILEG